MEEMKESELSMNRSQKLTTALARVQDYDVSTINQKDLRAFEVLLEMFLFFADKGTLGSPLMSFSGF